MLNNYEKAAYNLGREKFVAKAVSRGLTAEMANQAFDRIQERGNANRTNLTCDSCDRRVKYYAVDSENPDYSFPHKACETHLSIYNNPSDYILLTEEEFQVLEVMR